VAEHIAHLASRLAG